MEQQYKDPVLRKYGDLIMLYNKQIKRIYYGDPIRVGSSSLPALILAKSGTDISNFSNAEDRHQMKISISVITDVRDTISEDVQMVKGVNALYNILEGRNEDFTLKADSILGILRKYVELDVANNLRTDLNTVTRAEYGMTMGKRREDSWSIEGIIELVATFTQPRGI